MGKKKGKKQPPSRQGVAATAGAGPRLPGDAVHQDSEPDPDFEDAAWLDEQRRLLEQFSRAKDVSCGSSGDAGHASAAPDPREEQTAVDVMGRQWQLLAAAKGAGETASQTCRKDVVEVFVVRRINFLGRCVPVLLQSRNGPCPMLAVANGLLLRGTLELKADEAFLTSVDLLSRLTELCERLNARAVLEDANTREAMREVIAKLPQLLDGLLLNCRFGACSDFEYTAELGLFDLFGLRLYHAWVEPAVVDAGAPSWNALAERLAVCAELRSQLDAAGRVPRPDEDELLAKGLFFRAVVRGYADAGYRPGRA